MQIITNVNTIQYNKPQKISFNGLTHAMSKSFYANKAHIDNLVYAYPKADGFVGNIPKEFIKAIKSNNQSSLVGEAISEVKSVFAESSDILQKIAYKKQYNARKNYLKNKVMDTFLINLATQNENNLFAISRECYFAGALSQNILKNETKFVSNKITDVFRKTNIIPNNANVSVSYIDSGAYGDVFKMSFLDSNNKKLFHDKVIKVYKSQEDVGNMFGFVVDALHEIPKTISKQDFTKKLSKNVNSLYRSYDDKYFEDCYELIKNCSRNDFSFMRNMGFLKNIHGVAPEANAALYLKKSIGHPIANTDLIEPHCFDIKHNYGILELADNELKTIKETNFKPLGVKFNDDTVFNYKNDKLIDYGGFNITDEKLVKDKIARKAAKIQTNHSLQNDKNKSTENLRNGKPFSFMVWSGF